jgi:hypothetical protein
LALLLLLLFLLSLHLSYCSPIVAAAPSRVLVMLLRRPQYASKFAQCGYDTIAVIQELTDSGTRTVHHPSVLPPF